MAPFKDARDGGPTSDSVLYWLMLIIGSVPVGWALARHSDWGVEPTLGGVLVVCAVIGLFHVAT